MAQERKQLDWRWIWLGAAAALVLLFFAVRSLTRERLQVRVVQVSRQQLTSLLSTNGSVEPVENHEIHSPLATTVKAVYVQPGEQVAAGKVLAQLDDVQAHARVATAENGVKAAQALLDTALHNGTPAQQQAGEADIAHAKLDRDQAQHDFDALMKLNSTGAASASEVAAAHQRLLSAQAGMDAALGASRVRYTSDDVARARAGLADAEANLAAAKSIEAQTTVRAPVAGTVYSLDIRPTAFIEEGRLLMQIADLKKMRVRAYFDEPDLGKLAPGQHVEVQWDAQQGRVWQGHIDRVPSTVGTYGTRNVGEVLIALDSPDGLLLPDTHVTVNVTVASENNVLSVPREALHKEQGQTFVYRVVHGELKRTPVTTGTYTTMQEEILSGLNEGDWVATGTPSGQPLQQNMPIKEVQ